MGTKEASCSCVTLTINSHHKVTYCRQFNSSFFIMYFSQSLKSLTDVPWANPKTEISHFFQRENYGPLQSLCLKNICSPLQRMVREYSMDCYVKEKETTFSGQEWTSKIMLHQASLFTNWHSKLGQKGLQLHWVWPQFLGLFPMVNEKWRK